MPNLTGTQALPPHVLQTMTKMLNHFERSMGVNTCHTRPKTNNTKQTGISLVELLVGVTIGLLVVLSGVGTLVLTKTTTGQVADSALLAQQGNNLLRQMTFFVRQAGAIEALPVDASADAVQQTFGLGNPSSNSVPVAIYGVEGTSGARDEITVWTQHRFRVTGGRVFENVLRDCVGNTSQSATTASGAKLPTSVTGLGTYAQPQMGTRFFWRAADSTRPNQLVCDTLWALPGGQTSATYSQRQPIADNVEDFQVRYLLQTNLGSTATGQWVDASRFNNSSSHADWLNVVAVELCIEVRGEIKHGSAVTGTYVNCRGATTSHADYQRSVLRQTVQLRNRMNNL